MFGFRLGLFHGVALYGFVALHVSVAHDVCIVLRSSMVFLAFVM